MPESWYPKAVKMPGVAAGYTWGHDTEVRIGICHYTVGIDSTGAGLNGLFELLVRRNGEIVQFAEIDAITQQACEWNPSGPGIEVEYMPGVDDTIFTDAARQSCSGLIHWLNTEWGIPLVYYHGDRLPIGSPYRGFVAHGSLVHKACDQHTDYWPQEDWDLMVASPRKDRGMLYSVDGTNFYGLDPDYGFFPVPVAHDFSWAQIDQATFDKLNVRPKVEVDVEALVVNIQAAITGVNKNAHRSAAEAVVRAAFPS